MDQFQDVIHYLQSTIDKVQLYSGYKIVIIASVLGKTKNYADYCGDSVKTCFLGQEEISQMVYDLQRLGLYCEVYYDFDDFIANTKNKLADYIVFESSPKGIGRARDSLIPALCDLIGVKHVGTDALCNAIFSSKYHWTSILSNNHILTPQSHFFSQNSWVTVPTIGKKYLIKLNNECASIGLSEKSLITYDGGNIDEFVTEISQRYCQPVIAQEFIEGIEVEIPVISNGQYCYMLPPIGLAYNQQKVFVNRFFAYDTILTDDYSFYPYEDISVIHRLRTITEKINRIFDVKGYYRVDCRINDTGIYIFDINNDPAITHHSTFENSFTYLGFDKNLLIPALVGNIL